MLCAHCCRAVLRCFRGGCGLDRSWTESRAVVPFECAETGLPQTLESCMSSSVCRGRPSLLALAGCGRQVGGRDAARQLYAVRLVISTFSSQGWPWCSTNTPPVLPPVAMTAGDRQVESTPCAAVLGCVGRGCVDCLCGVGVRQDVALNRQAVQHGCTVLALANAPCQDGCVCWGGGGFASSAPFSWHG